MLVLGGYFAWQYYGLRREHAKLIRNNQQLTANYTEANEKLVESQRFLERLRNDPEFVEMFIRRRLGYAKPGELIYNFEEPAPGEIPAPLPVPENVENPSAFPQPQPSQQQQR